MALNEGQAPTRDEVLAIAERTKIRALAWLKRKGHLARREDESNEAPAPTALEACAQLAMRRGEFADVRPGGDVAQLERPSCATAVETDGFNVHAGVRIARDDDLGREKLCRYGTRPLSRWIAFGACPMAGSLTRRRRQAGKARAAG